MGMLRWAMAAAGEVGVFRGPNMRVNCESLYRHKLILAAEVVKNLDAPAVVWDADRAVIVDAMVSVVLAVR